ncbi:Protein of unknown function [Gryllus bimaculatus]|nr:Protein of unknown function [Gryllus bimaculatus]
MSDGVWGRSPGAGGLDDAVFAAGAQHTSTPLRGPSAGAAALLQVKAILSQSIPFVDADADASSVGARTNSLAHASGSCCSSSSSSSSGEDAPPPGHAHLLLGPGPAAMQRYFQPPAAVALYADSEDGASLNNILDAVAGLDVDEDSRSSMVTTGSSREDEVDGDEADDDEDEELRPPAPRQAPAVSLAERAQQFRLRKRAQIRTLPQHRQQRQPATPTCQPPPPSNNNNHLLAPSAHANHNNNHRNEDDNSYYYYRPPAPPQPAPLGSVGPPRPAPREAPYYHSDTPYHHPAAAPPPPPPPPPPRPTGDVYYHPQARRARPAPQHNVKYDALLLYEIWPQQRCAGRALPPLAPRQARPRPPPPPQPRSGERRQALGVADSRLSALRGSCGRNKGDGNAVARMLRDVEAMEIPVNVATARSPAYADRKSVLLSLLRCFCGGR